MHTPTMYFTLITCNVDPIHCQKHQRFASTSTTKASTGGTRSTQTGGNSQRLAIQLNLLLACAVALTFQNFCSDDVNVVQKYIRSGHQETVDKALRWIDADGSASRESSSLRLSLSVSPRLSLGLS